MTISLGKKPINDPSELKPDFVAPSRQYNGEAEGIPPALKAINDANVDVRAQAAEANGGRPMFKVLQGDLVRGADFDRLAPPVGTGGDIVRLEV